MLRGCLSPPQGQREKTATWPLLIGPWPRWSAPKWGSCSKLRSWKLGGPLLTRSHHRHRQLQRGQEEGHPPHRRRTGYGRTSRKVKNNQVLDQTDEAEIPELGQADIDQHFKALHRIKGGPVRPEAEPSPDQISAMKVRVLQLDMAPYADFGIYSSAIRGGFRKPWNYWTTCYNRMVHSGQWRYWGRRRTTWQVFSNTNTKMPSGTWSGTTGGPGMYASPLAWTRTRPQMCRPG